MQEKNLVEEAVIQLKNLEEAINENAKEILASTMKEEISELVKESMKNEAEEDVNIDDVELSMDDESSNEDEIEMDMDMDDEDEIEMDLELDSDDMEDEIEMDMDMDDEMDSDDEMTVDLTDASDEEILKVFKSMNDDDTISIEKDGDYIHLTDEDDEYLIQTESLEEEMTEDEDGFEVEDEKEEIFYEGWDTNEEENDEEIVYEIELDDEESDWGGNKHDYKRRDGHKIGDVDGHYKDYEMEEEVVSESTTPKVGKDAKTGKPKFDYKKSKGGFNEKMKQAKTTKGHSHKFEFTEGETFEMGHKMPKLGKEEAKEAARTYGFGSKEGRGLRKGITPNRNLTFENREIMDEVEMLRAKNEEYRKALNMFKDKLNEVAVFNSNLAYATRLFTEHSTSKQEKINILRRFDSAESLKESKALYKTIKDELGTTEPKFVTESIEKVIEKAPQSGSAINLIESKTYENPQFMRMKDIMSKIIK